MMKSIIDMLFPEYCLLCGKPGTLICTYCSKKLIPSLPECYRCRRLSPSYKTHSNCKVIYSLDSVFWAWQYNSLSSKFIKQLKYKGSFSMSKKLANFLAKRVLESGYLKQFTNPILIPIPLHKRKEKERGFNQSLLITELLSKELSIPLSRDLLFRNIYSKAQAEKSSDDRKILDEKTFSFNWNLYVKNFNGKEIILVDDVITTSTTLEIATRSIKRYSKEIKVSALCIFRGKPNYSSAVSSGIPSACLISRTTP